MDELKEKLNKLLQSAGNDQLNLTSAAARDYLVVQILNLIKK